MAESNSLAVEFRANRYLNVLRATLKDALAEGVPVESDLVRSILIQIDGLLYVVGEGDTKTEKFINEGERMIADNARTS